jgi:hypothetical protein
MNTLMDIIYAVGLAGGFAFVLFVCDGVFDLCYAKIPRFHNAVDRFFDSLED